MKPFLIKKSEDIPTLLSISFFSCLIPTLFDWFGYGAPKGMPQVAGRIGLSTLNPVFVVSVILYYFAVWGKAFRRLKLGVLAHVLLAISYVMAYYNLPITGGISHEVNPALSHSVVQPGFWIAVVMGGLHFLLFLSVEIRCRKATRTGTSRNSES